MTGRLGDRPTWGVDVGRFKEQVGAVLGLCASHTYPYWHHLVTDIQGYMIVYTEQGLPSKQKTS